MEMNTRLTVNEEIPQILSKYGSLTYRQLYYFMKPAKVVNAETKERKIKSIEKYVESYKKGEISCTPGVCWMSNTSFCQEMIDSVWAMIDLLKPANETDLPISEALQNSFCLERPESVSFIRKNRFIIRVMAVEKEENLPSILFVQDKIYNMYGASRGEEDKILCTLLIVIRDKKFMGKISQMNLTIPHKIALLEGGLLEEPTVKYFGGR